MKRLALLVLTASLLTPGFAVAQQTDTIVTDTIYLHAQRLVAEGQGDSGRAIVQRQLEAAPTGSPAYVEALYWRGALAATTADAERDLKRIIIDYVLSPRVDDALLRLAQLEMVRGDRVQALAHLERLVLEHPTSVSRAKASYWLGRVLLEDGKLPRACVRLAEAKRLAPPSDAELRNQVDYYAQRCVGVDTSIVISAQPVPSSQPVTPAQSLPSAQPVLPSPRPITPATPPVSSPVPSMPTARVPVVRAQTIRQEYTVQVAAFPTRGAATALEGRMKARGYSARVIATGSLYRVRIGRYASRSEAAAVARELRAKRIDSFVVEAEPR
ncbi:MAG: SPOR domain-containing protein [Gemmatimonadaceae bacterium]